MSDHDIAPETRHERDCEYVTSDGPAPCTCKAADHLLKIGDRVPMPRRKLDIRPAFTGADKPSFKPARKGK